MKIIAHRRNTLDELHATPTRYGVEVDIRSHGSELIIHHDPYVPGEAFEPWIRSYRHGTLILNIKEEGLEKRLIDEMKIHGIVDYFFLDQSFPFLIKWLREGERRCAVRVSQYESIATAMTLAGQLDWVWVDCFTQFPLIQDEAMILKKAGFKLCVVSPELHGRDPATEIPKLKSELKSKAISPDAVCTKWPALWEASDPL